MEQYHLNGKRMSRRAVRVQELDPTDAEKNLTDAAKIVGKEATILELKKVEWRNGVKRFVVEVSDPCDNPMDPSVKWTKLKPGDLDDPGAFFNTKDMMFLEALFREYHEISADEQDALMGKALPVSAG